MMRFFVLFITCLDVFCAYSQDISTEDSISLENVMISTTRVGSRDPVSFQNITLQEISRIQVGQDPAILLQNLSPSIISYSDGGNEMGNYAQFRLRGIDQDRVNISLNGVPLNDMADHGVYFSNFSDFGNSIQSIQIQRGVAASNNGTASFAGAINFESINLFGDQASVEGQLTIGSFGAQRMSAEFNTGKLTNNTGFYSRMTRTVTDGYKYNSGSEAYSFFLSGGHIGKKDMLKLTAIVGKTENGQSYEFVPLSDIKKDPKTNFNPLNDIDDFNQQMLQVQYARQTLGGTWSSTVYYNGADGVFPYTFNGSQYMYGLTNHHWGAMTHFNKESVVKSWQIGLHGYRFDRTNFEYISPYNNLPYARDFTNKNELSGHAKYSRMIGALTLYSNMQLRNLSMVNRTDADVQGESSELFDQHWFFLNLLGGINYELSTEQSLYLSYGKSAREPTRSDLLNEVQFSESVLDLELGWRWRKKRVQLEINAFHMNFTNEISKIGAIQERSYMEIRQNVPKSKRYGLEWISSFQLNDQHLFTINGNYMETSVASYFNGVHNVPEADHILAPRWLMQGAWEYNVTASLRVRVAGRYVSSSHTELSNLDSFTLPKHFLLNGQISLQLSENFDVNLMVNNLTNALYFTEGGPVDSDFDGFVDQMGYRIQAPRHINIMARVVF